MMRFRWLILTILVTTCAVNLHADPQPTDPRLIINNGATGSPMPVGLDFVFMTNGSGGGMFSFTNDSGEDWTRLEIVTPSLEPADVITCGGDAFASCVVLPQPGDSAIIDFAGGPGIMNGGDFTIDLGTSGWPPDGSFQAFANVPESSTLSLYLIGLAPLLARRLRGYLR